MLKRTRRVPGGGGRPLSRTLPLSLLLLIVAALAGCLAPAGGADAPADDPRPGFAPFPTGSGLGTTRLFTRVGEPGYPEGIAVDGNRVYVSSAELEGPGAVFVHDLETGARVSNLTLEAPDKQLGAYPDGALGLALDAQGRLYVTQLVGARILRVDPAPGGAQDTYAQLPDLPPCATAPASPCSPTATDRKPIPNVIAFGPEGSLYVSDSMQATIFRVPPGGGEAEPWFQDARFDAPGFGANGIAVSPGDAFLYVAHTFAGAGAEGMLAGSGVVWRVPLNEAPATREMELVRHYPDWAVDGIAFGRAGRLYATLLKPDLTGGAISVLAPDGTEVAFFPAPEENRAPDTPYDVPANVAFHDAHRSILITNLAKRNPDHWAVLEAFVDDTGHPLHRPEVP